MTLRIHTFSSAALRLFYLSFFTTETQSALLWTRVQQQSTHWSFSTWTHSDAHTHNPLLQGVTVLEGGLLLTATRWPPSRPSRLRERLEVKLILSGRVKILLLLALSEDEKQSLLFLFLSLSVKAHESWAKSSSSQGKSSCRTRRTPRTRRLHVWVLQDGVQKVKTVFKKSRQCSKSQDSVKKSRRCADLL